MTTSTATTKRREAVSRCLQKSLTSPSLIFNQLKNEERWHDIQLSQITNDLYWMRKNSAKWLSGHALSGYVFSTQQTLEQFRDIELELQSMRQKTTVISEKISILHELKDTINMRWVIEGEGQALMAINHKFGS